jgi:hypothetical protein
LAPQTSLNLEKSSLSKISPFKMTGIFNPPSKTDFAYSQCAEINEKSKKNVLQKKKKNY